MKFRNPETNAEYDAEEAINATYRCKTCYEKGNCRLGRWCMSVYGGTCVDAVKEFPHEAAYLMGYEVVEDDNSARTITVEYENCPQCGKNGGMIQNTLTGAICCMECGWTNKKENNMDKPIEGMCCDCVYGGPCCSWEENESCQHKKDNGVCWKPYTREEDNMDKPRICEVLGVEVGEEFSTASTFRMMYHITEAGAFLDSAGNYPNAHVVCDLISNPDHIIRKPRFTEQEVEDAKYIKRILKVDSVRRNIYGNGLISMKSDNSVSIVVNSEMFPSIHPGQSYTLDEIIGGAE